MAEDAAQRGCALRGAQRFEVVQFAPAEHEHAASTQVRVEAGQREPRLLRVRNGDAALEACGSGEKLEIERARLG